MLGRTILRILIAISLTAVSGVAQTERSDPRDDAQVWGEVQLTAPVSDRIDLVFSGSMRIGRDVSSFVQERANTGVSFKLNKYVSVSPFYSYIRAQPVAGSDDLENRLNLAVTFSLPAGAWSFSDRNLIERRFRDGDVSSRYRNRFLVERRIKNNKSELKLFAGDEVFYDWASGGWVRNRFTIGAGKRLSAKLWLDLYYLRQNDGHTRPGDLHVVGSMLRINL